MAVDGTIDPRTSLTMANKVRGIHRPPPEWARVREELSPLFKVADQLLRLSEFGEYGERRPAPGSVAANQVAKDALYEGEWGQMPVTTAFTLAGHTLVSAEQHLEAVTRLYRPHDIPLTFPPITLLRATLEAAARSLWLSDSTIDERERIARAKTLGLYSNFELMKAAPAEQRQEIRDSNLKVYSTAVAFGFDAVLTTKDAPGHVGTARPWPTDAIEALLDRSGIPGMASAARALWRQTSAVGHAVPWGISSYVVPVGLADNHGVLVVNEDEVVGTTAFAACGYLTAAHEYRSVRGMADERWESARGEALAELTGALAGFRPRIEVRRLDLPR